MNSGAFGTKKEAPRSPRSDMEYFLSLCGATRVDELRGLPGQIRPLFSNNAPHVPIRRDTVNRLEQAALADILPGLPLAHFTALQFAWHDVSRAALLPEEVSGKLVPWFRPGQVINLRSGALTLGSVYGTTGVTGDISDALNRCLRWPWGRAKLWVGDVGRRDQRQGDLLRLHRIVHGDGALLDEWFFEALPRHLRQDFFAEGDLRLDRAIIPDIRNDGTLLLSQFHRAIVDVHLRVVDLCDAVSDGPRDWRQTFSDARAGTTRAFLASLTGDVLNRVCDRRILQWSRENAAPFYRRQGRELPFLPSEALAVMPTLLEVISPRVLAIGERQLAETEFRAPNGEYVLPKGLFLSPRVPMRLAPEYQIRWRDFIGPECQTVRTGWTGAGLEGNRLEPELQAANRVSLGSGQFSARAANKAGDLGLPVIPHRDVLAVLGLDKDGTSESDLLAYVLAETKLYGLGGKLGPFGSLILAETMLGASRFGYQAVAGANAVLRLSTTELAALLEAAD